MSQPVTLRPLAAGELAAHRSPDSPFEDFGPRSVGPGPPACDPDGDGKLAVVRGESILGTVGWVWTQWGPTRSSRCPMIGIWVSESYRGQGVGTTAQRLVLDLLFRHTRTNRVEAHTDVANVAEQRALTRAGFCREGTVRGAQWRDGAFHDGYLYSILRNEWSCDHPDGAQTG